MANCLSSLIIRNCSDQLTVVCLFQEVTKIRRVYRSSETNWSEFPDPSDFGTQIEWALALTEWRQSEGMSQGEVAKALGTTQSFISSLETCREPISEIGREYFRELKENGPKAAKAKRKELLIQKIMG